MARTIGEGFVRVRPDTSGFGPEAERNLNSAMERIVGRLDRVLARLEPVAARAGQHAGRRFAGGVERETSRLRPLLSGLFRVGGAVALGAGLAYVTAQAIALTSAIVPAVGAIALLPGAAMAAAAGLGVLALATANLGDALAESTGGGGARAAAAAYEAAQRRIAAAQRDAQRAAQDLLDVRKEEAARIRELALDVEGAALAQERAARSADEARQALDEARQSGDADAIADADLAYRESLHTLAEAKDRHAELAAEQAHAAAVGVEGSRAVQDALQRQRDAQAELADAQKAAATATAGATGAVSKQAQAYAKLSPAARALVDTIKALAPAWTGLQRSVQQRVWLGVAGDVRALSGLYVPMLTARLGELGGAWNTAIRQTAGLAQSKAFVADVDLTLANTARTSDRLARAVAPIVSALRHLGVVGSQILPAIGDRVLTLAQRFERWTATARESGKLAQWMSGGLGVLRQLGAIALNVFGIITAIFRAGGAEAGGEMLAGLEAGTARLRAFLNSAEGQERISGVLTAVRNIVDTLITNLPRLADAAAELAPKLAEAAGEGGGLRDALSVADVTVGFLADNIDLLTKALPYLAAAYIGVKAAQVGANVAAVVSLPLRAAEVAATWGMRSAIQAHTAALATNSAILRGATVAQSAETAATNAGILARGRAVVSMAAHRAATLASTAAKWLLTAATTAFGVALKFALGPVGLIILAIGALIGIVVWAYRENETFRRIVDAVWRAIRVAIKAVVDWVVNTAWPWLRNTFIRIRDLVVDVYNTWQTWLNRAVGFVAALPGRIRSAARGLFDGVVAAAKGGINKVIDAWNRLDFAINIRVPDWVPGVGGKGFSVPDIFPDIPRLAEGGVLRARRGGRLFLGGEGGEDEAVAPLSALAKMIADAVRDAGGGRGINIEQVIIKAFSDRFSLRQIEDEFAMQGVT